MPVAEMPFEYSLLRLRSDSCILYVIGKRRHTTRDPDFAPLVPLYRLWALVGPTAKILPPWW